MAKQTINIGSAANDGTGSTLRAAFDITNDNFTELYDGTGGLLHKIEGTNFTGSLLIGHSTTGTLSAAIKNTGVGVLALDALTSGDSNTAIGYNAGSSINSGGSNVLIGSQAGDALTTGSSNVAIGKNALSVEDTTGNNVAVGHEALKNQNAGSNAFNVAVGYEAGDEVTTSTKIALIGGQAGTNLTTGGSNIAIGYRALQTEDEAGRVVAIGVEALQSQDSGVTSAHNTAIGFRAGQNITTGVENTILGAFASNSGTNDLTTGSNNIIIGYNAAASAVDISNEVTIGNSSIANVRIPADSTLKIGASGDLQLEHLSSNSFIKNTAVGDLYIENQVDDKDVIFRSDDGSGGLATYFFLDGSAGGSLPFTVFPDSSTLTFGTGYDLRQYHNGTDSYLDNYEGNLNIRNYADDKDIIFSNDNGSGGLAEYFRLDGSQATGSQLLTLWPDNSKIIVGDGADGRFFHDGTDTYLQNTTGDLQITNFTDDGDIIFKSDDGSGGTATYFSVDGGAVTTKFFKNTKHLDSVVANFGDSGDLQIYHDGTNSVLNNTNGHLQIFNNADDKDIVFLCDDGSGGNTEYFRVDGGENRIVYSQNGRHLDNVVSMYGSGADLQIKHDGSNSYVSNSTGALYIQQLADNSDIVFQSDDGSGGVTEYFRVDGGAEQLIFSKAIVNEDYRSTGVFYLTSGSDWRFRTDSGSEKVRITSGGNVGIGVTDPASKLEVDGGDIEVDDSGSGLILRSPDGTRYRVTVANGGTLSVASV